MNILITGGLGYVGGRLAKYFSEKAGFKVYALSRGKKLEKAFENFEVLSNSDVLEGNSIARGSIDVLIHLAAMNEHECVAYPLEAVDVNVKGTLSWLMWAQEKKVKKFIYFSTAHVYKKPLVGNLDETSAAVPVHPYAITHRCAEDYVLSYFFNYQLDTFIVRLSNSFGYPAYPTASRWTLFVNDVCRSVVKNRNFTINNNRTQQRDFVSLTDVCRAIEKLILYKIPERDNRIFNLSRGESRTLFDIGLWIKSIAEEYFEENVHFAYDVSKDNTEIPLHLSNEKLKKTGWLPDEAHDVEEIQKTLDYFLKNPH